MEAKYCPFCKGDLEVLSTRSYYCEKCKAIIQIAVEIKSLDSPLLNDEV